MAEEYPEHWKNCCTHYKTDNYRDGYVMFPFLKVKQCANCGEIHFVCGTIPYLLFILLFKWFWRGEVYFLKESEE